MSNIFKWLVKHLKRIGMQYPMDEGWIVYHPEHDAWFWHKERYYEDID